MFDSMQRLTASNKVTTQLKGFRFEHGLVSCTNMITTMSFIDEKALELDCFVDSKEFTDAIKPMKEPVFEQDSDCLRVKEGKFSVDLAFMDSLLFPKVKVPEGVEVSVGDLLGAFARIKPFFKNSQLIQCASLVYIIDDFVYYTTSDLIVRTPFMGSKFDEVTILTREFIDLLTGLGKTPVHFLETSYELGVRYEDGWIRTKQHSDPPPLDFTEFCAPLTELEIPELESELLNGLKMMCKQDQTNEGVVQFDSSGITLKTDGKTKTKLAISMPKVNLQVKQLKQVLGVANMVSFDYDEKMVAFRGDGIEGFLTIAPESVRK